MSMVASPHVFVNDEVQSSAATVPATVPAPLAQDELVSGLQEQVHRSEGILAGVERHAQIVWPVKS